MQKIITKVKSNQEIADKIYKLELQSDYDLDDYQPGKFIHIKCSDNLDPTLRRPMSICDINDEGDTMIVLYRVEGRGTELLAQKNSGDDLDLLAPLGVPFPLDAVEPGQKALMIGGGIGVPPLYYLSRRLNAKGVEIKTLLGFNSAKDVFYEQEFSKLGSVQVATMDGTYGYQGYVTDLMDEDWDVIYSCGPSPMLKTLQNKLEPGANVYLSLEERMACGIGACLACVCKAGPENTNKYNRVCTEGPVFKADAVVL